VYTQSYIDNGHGIIVKMFV